eukprot:Opistho-2@63489
MCVLLLSRGGLHIATVVCVILCVVSLACTAVVADGASEYAPKDAVVRQSRFGTQFAGKPIGADGIDAGRPSDVDVEVECGMRIAAWEYARMILPERGPNMAVFDGLRLGPYCHKARPTDEEHSPIMRANILAASKGYIADSHPTVGPALYVDAESGLDAPGRGSLGAPYRSLSFALTQSRALRPMIPPGVTLEILLRGGLYIVPDTIFVREMDSFLVIGAYGDEEPVMSAGCMLDKLQWKKVDAPASPGAEAANESNIYVANVASHNCGQFETLFVDGRRAVRARYPNANPETSGLHTTPTGYIPTAKSWLPPVKSPPAIEIHIDNLSRRNLFSTFSVGIGGSVSQFDPPVSYYAPREPIARGVTYAIATGLTYNDGDLPPNRTYAHPETGIVHTFHHLHWGGWQFRIDSHEPSTRTFKWSYGGFQEARGHSDGGVEYYIENLMEELDSPGEWFLDYATNNLYYYPNATDFQSSVFVASRLETIMSIEGSMKAPVRNVSVSGLTFTHTAPTFLKSYEVPSGGDWSVHRGAALFIEGTESVTVTGNVFNATGGNAIFLSNYNRGAVVARNEFFLVGDSAVVAVGSVMLNDGTGGNQPRGSLIEGNLIHDIGVFGKQVCGFIQSLACQTIVRNNIIFNGPRAGITLNDGFGGGNVLEGNLLFNLVRETTDHGPINTWDRVPYLHDLNGRGVGVTMMPLMSYITGNFVINNYQGTWAIDHDDGSMYYYDSKNVLVYGPSKCYLGHHQTVVDNFYFIADTTFPGKLSYRPYCIDTGADTDEDTSGFSNVWERNKCFLNDSHPVSQYHYPCNEVDTRGLIPFTAGNTFYTRASADPLIVSTCDTAVWDLNAANMWGYEIGSTSEVMPDSAAGPTIVRMLREFIGLDRPRT